MALWKPDPTFYPSPRMAMAAPPRNARLRRDLRPRTKSKPDALARVDLDPKSASYSQVVGRLEMPKIGDELHHFGWNACSAALCPYAPHPHVERRYLIVPGLRSSRIHIIDTKPDPRETQASCKIIEPEEIAAKTGYSRPHTIHCGPDAIYVSALGNPDGDGPGGIFLLDHESFDVLGRWEVDRGPQQFAYDFWWHLGYDVAVTSEWGTPNMIENGLESRPAAGRQIWPCDSTSGICASAAHLQALDLGAEHQLALELRPAHDPTKPYGFVGVVISTKDLSASIWTVASRRSGNWAVKKIIDIPRRARRSGPAAARAEGLQGGAAARHRYRPQHRRPVSLRRRALAPATCASTT